jgi:hypothetical protein
LYKKIYENIRGELATNIENMYKVTNVEEHYFNNNIGNILEIERKSANGGASNEQLIRQSKFTMVRKKYIEYLHEKDKDFGLEFCQTQLFLNFYEELLRH